MNRVAKIAIVSALSSLALAGVSRAESLGMNTTRGIDQTLRNFHGNDFNVQQNYTWEDPRWLVRAPLRHARHGMFTRSRHRSAPTGC